jgi:hypothetical protein
VTEEYKIIRGRSVSFEVSVVTELDQADHDALHVLDEECEGGPGGIWYIVKNGQHLVAHPNGPFESIVWVDGRWTELDDVEEQIMQSN